MAAASIRVSLLASVPGWPRAGRRRARLGLPNQFCGMWVLMLLLGCAGTAQATDPYAAALDERFSIGMTSPEARDAAILALEQGLKEQVRKMSQRQEPDPPPSRVVGGPQPCLVWAMLVGAGVGMALAGLIALRRWSAWLDTSTPKLAHEGGLGTG